MRQRIDRLGPVRERQVRPRGPLPRTRVMAPDWPGLATAALGIIALVAISMNFVVGTLSPVVFLLASFVLFALNPLDAARGIATIAPLLTLPALALVSVLWSEAPATTARAALQFLFTMVAAAIVARRVSERTAISGLFCGYLAICSTALPDIRMGLETGVPVEGMFASKNALGVYSQYLEVLSLAILFDRARPVWTRLAGLVALLFALLLVYVSRSAGALVLAMIAPVLFPVLLAYAWMSPPWRMAVAIGAMIPGLLLGLLASEVAHYIADFRQNVLGKDATMTGRTDLWDAASAIAAKRPLLGHGYAAFWRLGNIDAEALWRRFGIASRSGFNFHSELVDLKVSLGLIGTGLAIVLSLGVAAVALHRHLTRPGLFTALSISLLLCIYVRFSAESSLFYAFSASLIMWTICAHNLIRAPSLPPDEGPVAGSPFRLNRRPTRR